ncbi:flavodoxin family protein [Faecalibacillus intestinalis]|jgi:multimeric flavodoxin WrbA|uniref:Flavodoxin family protein n=1 Tax=Faecalibacillus intestinalis TaxID=1982626 RepID=A0A2T3G380_9FIRM|nr:flavodoxin family protein [Faecalibacillus intestinalis]MZK54603.1 flavodoxin family protein [Coprobacillus sp. BIOML-A1]PST41952.1 flavodoxin family protein [Faecalibacillus intestinalis]
MAQVLVLMSSPRKHGNTDRLANAFIKGVEENGYSTEKIYVNYQNIKPCLGCNVCQKTNQCVQKDDMQEIYEKMLEAKVIVFASPVYFYTFNASMKLLIDRTFAIEKTIHDKDFYLLTTGLAPEESYFRIIKDTFQKYIDCLRVGGNRFVDSILGFQTGNKDDIEKTNALEKAYNMAKEIKINEQEFNSLFFT